MLTCSASNILSKCRRRSAYTQNIQFSQQNMTIVIRSFQKSEGKDFQKHIYSLGR